MTAPWPITVATLRAAFTAGAVTPTEVVDRCLAFASQAQSLEPPHRAVHPLDEPGARKQSAQSTARFERGEALGLLDGVPIGVKDEVDVAGLPTRMGAAYLPSEPVKTDALCVERLRAAGAVVVGKTAQHELGLGATGVGPQAPAPRNPHGPDRIPGGSSSGSAVAVALGLSPLCVGTDAGGSIRIPASLCGIFGLKPTYGRVSRVGDANLNGSLGHVGALANSAEALAEAVRRMAGPDPRDPATLVAPSPFGAPRELSGLRGLRVGVVPALWKDASSPVAAACDLAVEALVRAGAERCELDVERIADARAIGYVIMGVEAAEYHRGWAQRFAGQMGLDVRIILGLGARIRGCDYVRVLRLRDLLRGSMARAFERVDFLAMPTTLTTAPPWSAAAEKTGELDDNVTGALTANTFLANVTGLPALTCPVGADSDGLPIGLQLVGPAWDEATLLGAAAWLEREQVAAVRRPKVSFDLLASSAQPT
jgi:aspartyl-tRNA(Asn)/glutamyl-tRNA(Gln) amidotransferase subunit A